MPSINALTAPRSMRRLGLATAVAGLSICLGANGILAQRPSKKYPRSAPPNLEQQDFSGVFFEDAVMQLQGDRPSAEDSDLGNTANNAKGTSDPSSDGASDTMDGGWEVLISDATVEDLVKESKSRLDATITTPAKFAAGGFQEARREFTLLATLMAIIDRYPGQIRWKNSANYAHRLFAKVASNSVVGTPPVYNEAKLRQQDLQDLLKGSTLSGNADEVTWEQTADRGPLMQILNWALREQLAPKTSNDQQFSDEQDDILKYAELIAICGRVLHQEGMTDFDDDSYVQMSNEMTQAGLQLVKAVQQNDPEAARSAVGRIDQSCNKCHESYR